MAYDVTKIVNGRAYRYRVRSERDPDSGKRRSRWTYLGRADSAASGQLARPRRNARAALLDALERLLEEVEPDEITAAAVSAEAGLAHGTFYRYFANKLDAIHAVMDRARGTLGTDPEALNDAPDSRSEARAALRGWARALLRIPTDHRGVLRAWHALAARDPKIGAQRRARREAYALRLTEHLRALTAAGFAHIDDAAGTAAALFAMLDGFYRGAIADGDAVDDTRVDAALALIDRGVFGT